MIYVIPGHTETVSAAAGINLDVAGISVIGLGAGSNRPTVTFTTAAAADLDIGAANVTVKNLLLLNDIDSQTAMVDVAADDFTMEDCELREGTAKQALIYINIGAANNDSDRCKIRNCRFYSATLGADSAIKLAQVQDGV